MYFFKPFLNLYVISHSADLRKFKHTQATNNLYFKFKLKFYANKNSVESVWLKFHNNKNKTFILI